jgi:hypothetical protein
MTRTLLCILLSMLAFLVSCGWDDDPPLVIIDPVKPVEPPPPEPVLTVDIDDTYGDRFKPVVVDVSYTLEDEPIEWTYETDLRAVRTDTGLLVYGNGDTYEGTVVINDSSFLVQLSSEPRCREVESKTDCLGYSYYGDSDGLVYYGEEDNQIVDWELVVLKYIGTCKIPSDVQGLCDDEVNDIERAESRVQIYNQVMENSGVFVRFVLKEYRYIESPSLGVGKALVDYLKGDIGIGIGTTCKNTCGCAYMYSTYTQPSFGWSICGWQVDLHEMGHGLGLGHGPENSAYAGTGSLFPEFGHGWMYSQCRSVGGDIMSYSSNSKEFLNSRSKCDNVDAYVTDRSYADSAYHLNRIRYDVSLVKDDAGTVESLRIIPFTRGQLILD